MGVPYRLAVLAAMSVLFCSPLVAQSNATSVVVLVEVTLKAGQEAAFDSLASRMAERVRREDHGNVRYELYHVGGANGQPASRVLIEEWSDKASFAAHGKWAKPLLDKEWREMSSEMKISLLLPTTTDTAAK